MKNTLAIILLSTVYLSTMSYDKRNDAIPGNDVVMSISVLDQHGNDLLDPDGESAINIDNIRLYYVIDGVEMEYEEQPHLDAPRGYFLGEPGFAYQYHFLVISLNSKDRSEVTTTILRWDNDKADTIKSQIIRNGTTALVDKVWYNEELLPPSATDPHEGKIRYHEVVWEN